VSIELRLEFEVNGSTEFVNVSSIVKKHLVRNDLCTIYGDKLVISDKIFHPKMKVKDVCRYVIVKGDDQKYSLKRFQSRGKYVRYSRFRDRSASYKSQLPAIVIVLESPHKDEYLYDMKKIKPIAPAQGVTGEKIDSYLIDIINAYKNLMKINQPEYRVLLVNPIPYQTSLYFFA
jgi:hypothetical protein